MSKDKEIIPDISLPNINMDAQNDISKLVPDEVLVNMYTEILKDIKNDRDQIQEYIENFADSVINNGDATSSSKEALVNLIKIKTDTTDKATKIADLMTRIKLKEKDTFPKYLAVHQSNTTNNIEKADKMELLDVIEKAKRGQK